MCIYHCALAAWWNSGDYNHFYDASECCVGCSCYNASTDPANHDSKTSAQDKSLCSPACWNNSIFRNTGVFAIVVEIKHFVFRVALNLFFLTLFIPFINEAAASKDQKIDPDILIKVSEFANARAPQLHSNDDKLMLSWAKGSGDFSQLQIIQLSDNQWSSVNTVAEGEGWLTNPFDYAQVIPLSHKIYIAVWLELTSYRDLSYRFNTRISKDGGKSWIDTRWPQELEEYEQHGFATAALSGDEIKFYWISTYRSNGRLLKSNLSLDGKWSVPEVVDNKVCSCCHLAINESFLLAYRDRSEVEIRDIAVIQDAHENINARIVHADDWEISGCPVNAPALSQKNDLIALSWFSGGANENEAGNRLAIGALSDSIHWNSTKLDFTTLGYVDLAWIDNETLAVSSVSTSEDATYIDLHFLKINKGVPESAKHLAIPVDSVIGAPSLVSFQGSLYMAYYSPHDSATILLRVKAQAILEN
jgi:hypothetical protein